MRASKLALFHLNWSYHLEEWTCLKYNDSRVDAVVMDHWSNGQLMYNWQQVWYEQLEWFYHFLHYDFNEIIVFASYLPVTSASSQLPLDYSTWNIDVGWFYFIYSLISSCLELWQLSRRHPSPLQWEVSWQEWSVSGGCKESLLHTG